MLERPTLGIENRHWRFGWELVVFRQCSNHKSNERMSLDVEENLNKMALLTVRLAPTLTRRTCGA